MKRVRRNKTVAEIEIEARPKTKKKRKRKQLIEAPIVDTPAKRKDHIRRRKPKVRAKYTPKKVTLDDVKVKPKRVPWNPEFLRMIYHMALLGAKEDQICDALGVSRSAIKVWKRTRPDVLKALREGKVVADAKMAESFYHAGVGYSHPEEVIIPNRVKTFNDKGKVIKEELKIKRVRRIKHYPPNVTAGTKWLQARHPELWADKQSGDLNAQIVNINTINFNDFSDDEIKVLAKMGFKRQGLDVPEALDPKFDDYEFIDDGTNDPIDDGANNIEDAEEVSED